MTQEEKAKAYDEALKVLHKYDGANIMFSQSLKEEMFPELKEESKDEKIRKSIIAIINNYVDNSNTFKPKMIAWLEKQGEQETVVVIPKFRVGDVIRPKGSMAEYTIESISGECYHGKGWGLNISSDDDYELVEQKSSWNKEDEKHRKWILEYLYDGLQKSDEQFKGQFKCAIAWLEKQVEQKSIWHDASEEPNGKEYVIAWDGKYASIARYKSIVNCKWCYLSDILPNKEKGVWYQIEI